MSILRDFEKRLERGVEGFFARTFKSGLQPVELAKALQRYASNYQQVGVGGVLIPNVYRFELSPEDMERFSGYADALAKELGDVVRRTADDNDWRLQGPVRIELRVSDGIRVGTYELRGKVEASGDGGAAPRPQAGRGVRVMDQPPAAPSAPPFAAQREREARTRILTEDAGRPQGVVVVHGARGGRHRLGDNAVLGRLPDCDVTLDDPSVSRRHARIRRDGNTYVIEDLRSTNGVRVNGVERDYARLSDGDDLELGAVRLSFSLEP